MSEEVMIQSIKSDRIWVRDEGTDALAKDIKKHGLRLPVLLDTDLNLIDGLRRIAAFESLGWRTIPAVVATTYEEACNALERVYGPDNPIKDYARAWEINQAVDPLLKARSSRLRSKYAGVPLKQRGTVPREPKSRVLFNQAMGTIYVTKAAELYRWAEGGSALAQDLVKQLEAGEITINAALHRLHGRSLRLTGPVVKPDEQKVLVSESVRGLSGLVKGLKKLNQTVTIPAEELEPLLAEMKQHRRSLIGLIRQIEKGHNSK